MQECTNIVIPMTDTIASSRSSPALLPINDHRWFEFISNHPDCTVFHHPAWTQLLEECYGYTPFVEALINEEGQICAGLPLLKVFSFLTGSRSVSLPFSDVCPPLCLRQRDLENLLRSLVDKVLTQQSPRIAVHFRLPRWNIIYPGATYYWHRTPLGIKPEAVFQAFDKTRVREPIRQAVRRGVEVHWGTGLPDLLAFWNMLQETRRRLGSPVQPKRFFRLLWDRIINQGLGFTLLAYKDQTLIAGVVVLHYNTTVIAKYSASDPRYWNLRANNLLYWEAIKWGCEHGFQWFDWGRTDLYNKNLRAFKNGWASMEETLEYSVISKVPLRPSNARAQKILGIVIRHAPSLLCRVVGELLYRHYA